MLPLPCRCLCPTRARRWLTSGSWARHSLCGEQGVAGSRPATGPVAGHGWIGYTLRRLAACCACCPPRPLLVWVQLTGHAPRRAGARCLPRRAVCARPCLPPPWAASRGVPCKARRRPQHRRSTLPPPPSCLRECAPRPNNPPPPAAPLCSLVKLVGTLTVGWPLYLFFNVSSHPYEKKWVNHFDPWSPIFRCVCVCGGGAGGKGDAVDQRCKWGVKKAPYAQTFAQVPSLSRPARGAPCCLRAPRTPRSSLSLCLDPAAALPCPPARFLCSKRERIEVAVSDVALLAVLYGLRQVGPPRRPAPAACCPRRPPAPLRCVAPGQARSGPRPCASESAPHPALHAHTHTHAAPPNPPIPQHHHHHHPRTPQPSNPAPTTSSPAAGHHPGLGLAAQDVRGAVPHRKLLAGDHHAAAAHPPRCAPDMHAVWARGAWSWVGWPRARRHSSARARARVPLVIGLATRQGAWESTRSSCPPPGPGPAASTSPPACSACLSPWQPDLTWPATPPAAPPHGALLRCLAAARLGACLSWGSRA